MDLKKYNIKTTKTTKPVYEKRYKNNGEEYLKQVDEIDIEEDLQEKQLEITRIKEIFNIQERLKYDELVDEMTNEEYLIHLKELENINEVDTYDFLNKMNEIKHFYNKMPSEIRMKYKNLSKFAKEYVPNFVKETEEKIKSLKSTNTTNTTTNITTNEELKAKIDELQAKLEKGAENNV